MKKIGVLCCLLALGHASSTFAQSKSGLAIYPIDSFDPKSVEDVRNLKISNPNDFVYTYMSEVGPFFKKGEFEKTVDYQDRIKGGLKLKGFPQDKLYAFKLDYSSYEYDADTESYVVNLIHKRLLSSRPTLDRPVRGTFSGNYATASASTNENDRIADKLTHLNNKYNNPKLVDNFTSSNNTNAIFVSSLKPTHQKYNISIDGGFYVVTSGTEVVFPVDIKTAKEASQCKKSLYLIGKLNEQPHQEDLNIQIKGQKNQPSFRSINIPMDIASFVFKCSNGKVLGSY